MNEVNANETPVATQGNNSRSIWSIMAGIFSSPSQAFADYAGKPQIWIPLIVIIVLVVLSTWPIIDYAGKVQYDLMKTSTILPPQALEQMRQDAENPSLLSAVGGPAIGIAIAMVVTTLVAWFFGAFVFGGQSKFKSIFGVTLLGSLISVAGGLVRIPLVLAKKSMYVSIGFCAMMPGKDFKSFLYSLFFYLDFFAIWSIIVTGIGYGIIFGISRNKGIAVSTISTILIVLVMIGLSAFGMSMAGVDVSFF